MIKPRTVDAIAANLGSPHDARAKATQMGGNVTIVRAADGTFAIVPADAARLDAHSAASATLPATVGQLGVNSYVTRHGDVLERAGEASGSEVPFGNIGRTDALDLKSTFIDPARGAGDTLTGVRLGLDQSGNVTELGAPVGDPAGYASPEVAARELFEAGTDSSALVTVGTRTYAFKVAGDLDTTTAKGSGLRQMEALRIQSGDRLLAFAQPGEALTASGQAATHDFASMQPADVAGLRLGTIDGTVVRIGEPVVDAAGYRDMGQAGLAAFLADEQGTQAVVGLGSKGYAFKIDGMSEGAKPSSRDRPAAHQPG